MELSKLGAMFTGTIMREGMPQMWKIAQHTSGDERESGNMLSIAQHADGATAVTLLKLEATSFCRIQSVVGRCAVSGSAAELDYKPFGAGFLNKTREQSLLSKKERGNCKTSLVSSSNPENDSLKIRV